MLHRQTLTNNNEVSQVYITLGKSVLRFSTLFILRCNEAENEQTLVCDLKLKQVL